MKVRVLSAVSFFVSFLLTSCATFNSESFCPKLSESANKLPMVVQIDTKSLDNALWRTTKTMHTASFVVYEGTTTRNILPVSVPYKDKIMYKYNYYDTLPLGEHVSTYAIGPTSISYSSQVKGGVASSTYSKYGTTATEKINYEYVQADRDLITRIINNGLSSVIVSKTEGASEYNTIEIKLIRGNNDRVPVEYTSIPYVACSLLLSTCTLGVSNLVGIPVGRLRGSIGLEATIRDTSGKQIKKYNILGEGYSRVALYNGYRESDTARAVYANAVNDAILQLAEKIKTDAPWITMN